MKNRLPLILFFSVCITFLISCENKWKQPAPVVFNFDINDDVLALKTSAFGQLQFVSGYITIDRIAFTGERKQTSKAVPVEKEEQITFDFNDPASALHIGIPQGTYTKVDIEVDIADPDEGEAPSLVINGIYWLSSDVSMQVRFEYMAGNKLKAEAKAADGSGEIVLVEDVPIDATITVDPLYWFGDVTENMMRYAEPSYVDGQEIIIVNDETNEEIYEAIVKRIPDAVQVTF